MKIAKGVAIVAAFGLCFLVGIFAVPLGRLAYAVISPQPEYTTGSFMSLYRESGRRVVLFSTSTCPYCNQTRALLDKAGVAYADYKIDQSDESNKKFSELGGVGVPLLYIGNRSIQGFREHAIRDALAVFEPAKAMQRSVAGH